MLYTLCVVLLIMELYHGISIHGQGNQLAKPQREIGFREGDFVCVLILCIEHRGVVLNLELCLSLGLLN